MGPHSWCSLAVFAALCTAAHAAPAKARYDIPSQSLDQALLQIGSANARQIVFAPDAVRGRVSRPVRGELELMEALGRMLPPDLEAEERGPFLIIRPAAALDTAATPGGSAGVVGPAPITPVDELVVTALRYETLLQRTPVSMSFLGNGVAERGETSLDDVYRRVPGLHLTSNGSNQQRMAIRGVRSAGEATTGLYYDETPVTGPAGSAADAGSTQPDLSLFDVQRIEILRGPQGTLYGAGSMGGTVRVIFNKPDAELAGGRVEVRGAITQSGAPTSSVRIVGNLPVVPEKLAARLAFYGENVGGYIDNVRFGREDINGARSGGYRASVAFTPTPALSLHGVATRQSSTADDAIGYWYPRLGRYKTDAGVVARYESDLDLANLTARWDGSSISLLATLSQYRWETLYVSDYTATLQRSAASPAACSNFFSQVDPCGGDQAAVFSAYAQARIPGAWRQPSLLQSNVQEVRASSPPGGRIDWTVGIFREDRRDHFDSIVLPVDAASGTVLSAQLTGYRTVETRVRQNAGFGEINLRPVTGVTVTGGARRYDYKKSVGGEVLIPNRITGSDLTPFRQVTASDDGWVTKLSVAVEPTERSLFYATRSMGFRPGGANNVPGAGAEVPEAYAPDRLSSHEFGSKIGLFGGKVTIDSAAYVIDWRDMQVSAASPNGAWRFNTNAGRARIRGGEIEIVATPVPGLWMMLAGAYNDARLVNDQSNGVGVGSGRVGDRIPFTPRWSGAASGLYRRQVLGLKTASRLDYSYTGSAASELRPGVVTYQRQPPYSLVDLQFSAERDGLEASLRLTNAFNVRGAQMMLTNLSGTRDQTYSVRPRTLTLGLRRSF